MNRTRAALSWVTAVVLAHAETAQAVCVDGPLSVERQLRESVAIVVARVESEHETQKPPPGHDPGTTYRVAVTERIRGTVGKTVDLLSENNTGRFPMVMGQSYLLFISRGPSALFVDNCGNSGTVVEKRELLAQLRKSKN